MTPALARRFWSKANKDGPTQPHMTTPCWVWTASRSTKGYGCIRVGGKTRKAHRVAYELDNGPIPDGMMVLHRCDNPPCVRHLFLGTNAENVADMMAKGRNGVVPPDLRMRGEMTSSAKLTCDAVLEIRRLRADGLTHREIAERWGVGRSTVTAIIQGKNWTHVLSSPAMESA